MWVSVAKWALTYKLYLPSDLAFKQVWMPVSQGDVKISQEQQRAGYNLFTFLMTGSVRNWSKHAPYCVCTCIKYAHSKPVLLLDIVLETSPVPFV